jgi:hypothetical protein
MNLAPYTQTLTLYTPHATLHTQGLPEAEIQDKLCAMKSIAPMSTSRLKKKGKKCKQKLCAMASIAPMSTSRSTAWSLGFGVWGLRFGVWGLGFGRDCICMCLKMYGQV